MESSQRKRARSLRRSDETRISSRAGGGWKAGSPRKLVSQSLSDLRKRRCWSLSQSLDGRINCGSTALTLVIQSSAMRCIRIADCEFWIAELEPKNLSSLNSQSAIRNPQFAFACPGESALFIIQPMVNGGSSGHQCPPMYLAVEVLPGVQFVRNSLNI